MIHCLRSWRGHRVVPAKYGRIGGIEHVRLHVTAGGRGGGRRQIHVHDHLAHYLHPLGSLGSLGNLCASRAALDPWGAPGPPPWAPFGIPGDPLGAQGT